MNHLFNRAMLVALAFTVCGSAFAQKTAQSRREVLNFNTNWTWFDYDVENGQDPALKANDGQDICLPHSVVLFDLFDIDPEDWRKITWYRRDFRLSEEYSARRVVVNFQGAGQVNRVYVNGALAGEHVGVYTSFDIDITDHVKFGDADNVIAVQVDSGEHRELPPTGSDFHYFGGLHRDVSMTIVDPLRVDYSYVWTEPAEKGVVVKAKVRVINDYPKPHSVDVVTKLIDAEGNEISVVAKKTRKIRNNFATVYYFEHVIEEPHLWSLNDPYLHQFVTEVSAWKQLVDREVVSTGLRWISSDPKNSDNARIRLNGEVVRLFGLNRHEQYPYLGNAGPNRYHRRDAEILKYQTGCNVVRTSHYTNDPDFLSACDRVGILVIAENLGWGSAGDADWRDAYKKQLRAMILRDRNHPSIAIWSIMINEGPSNLLDWEDGLNEMVKGLDPTRLTADHTNRNKGEFITDVYHRHCYTPDGMITPTYQPWVFGEFNNRLGSNFIVPGDNESRKVRMLLKDGIKSNLMWGNSRVAGIVRWDAFGYLTPNNIEPYGSGPSFKNLAEYRNSGVYGCYRNPRYLAYWWQAQASPEQSGEMVKVLCEWKSDSSSTVYVASNGEQVELLLNDASVGKIEPNVYADMNRGLFMFEGVEWTPKSRLTAKSWRGGKVVAEDIRYASSYEGQEAKLVLASKTGDSIVADGSDMAWIEASIVDANGQVCDYADANLTITSLDGPARAIHKVKPIQLPNPPANAGERMIQMTDGLGVFHLQSQLNKTGAINVAAAVDLGVSFDDGDAAITYVPAENWVAAEQPEAFGGGVHYSGPKRTEKDHILVNFTGEQIRLYGGKASNFGTMAVSIDGGEEVDINCYTSPDRHRQNILLYTSPVLPVGKHQLKIRVTNTQTKGGRSPKGSKGSKGAKSDKGASFNIDRVKVMDGKADLKSDALTIQAEAFTDKVVPNAGS